MGYLKRTANRAEISSIRKGIAAGVPMRVISRDLNIREDCLINFATEEQKKQLKKGMVDKDEFPAE